MNKPKQIILTIIISIIIFFAGAAGYMFIEKWSFFDSAYMTIITLSTVGFSEVHEISQTGRILTIILIFTGVSFFVYLTSVIMQFVVKGEIKSILGRRKLDKTIKKLKNHYIVCGYGRIGRILCKLLKEQTSDIVVIEKDMELISVIEKDKTLYLTGDAADESLLLKAGIKKASYLIAALGRDADNVFLVLTARQLNSKIYIMARSETRQVKSKLFAAGADRVESPYDVGAVAMGLRLLKPSLSTFLDIALSKKETEIQIEEISISPRSDLINTMLKDSGIREKYNIIIIAINKLNKEMIFNPSFETYIEKGDIVIAMGRASSLKKFHNAMNL